MFINNRSQPALLTFVKLKGFSMFQQYCLWRNSFEQIHKILYEKCSWKKIKFCLFNKKLDNKREDKEVFTSSILPRYLRRIPSLDNLIPALYLKGISTGDFTEALSAILGDKAKGLSANTIVRLKRQWEEEYKQWSKRELTGKRYVYFWADGIYFNVRLEDPENKKQCFIIIIGALEDGTKELVAVLDGYRESKLSWMELLSGLKQRGLEEGPLLAIGDGGLGFWAAMSEIYPETTLVQNTFTGMTQSGKI